MSLRKTFNKVPECFAGAQQGEGVVWRPPLLFFENKKKCPDFSKKGPDCVHPYVKCTIQNVVLRVCKRKNFKIFPCGVFFLEFLTKCLSECPNFTKSPLP